MRRLESASRQTRLPALTGIRIFAALAVYLSHIGAPAGVPNAVANFFYSGYSGVTLFFVLSGFVLSINYFEDLRRPGRAETYRYLVARVARIYPLYLLVLFFVVVQQHAFGGSVEGWWRSALALQAWSPDLDEVYRFNPPAWSISVEFFLYACFPLLVPAVARLKRPRSVLAGAALVVVAMLALAAWFVYSGRGDLVWTDPASAHRWLYLMPLTRLGDFALGILAARLYVQTREQRLPSKVGMPLALAAALAVAGLMLWPEFIYTPWSWDVGYAVPAAVFIFGLATLPGSWLARLFSLPFIVLLGEASYAFYLIHDPAIGFLQAGQWKTNFSATMLVYEGLLLGIVMALAVGLHMTVERPARTYVRRLLSGRRSRRAVPTEAAAAEPAA